MPYDFPQDRYYEPQRHLWLKREPDTGRVVVGIDALGIESMGDLAYIALAKRGTSVVRGKSTGTLEAAKMTDELIAPITGTVHACNEKVLRDPSLVNRDNYGAGWLFSLEPTAWESESKALIFGPALEPWVASEIKRFSEQGWINPSGTVPSVS